MLCPRAALWSRVLGRVGQEILSPQRLLGPPGSRSSGVGGNGGGGGGRGWGPPPAPGAQLSLLLVYPASRARSRDAGRLSHGCGQSQSWTAGQGGSGLGQKAGPRERPRRRAGTAAVHRGRRALPAPGALIPGTLALRGAAQEGQGQRSSPRSSSALPRSPASEPPHRLPTTRAEQRGRSAATTGQVCLWGPRAGRVAGLPASERGQCCGPQHSRRHTGSPCGLNVRCLGYWGESRI